MPYGRAEVTGSPGNGCCLADPVTTSWLRLLSSNAPTGTRTARTSKRSGESLRRWAPCDRVHDPTARERVRLVLALHPASAHSARDGVRRRPSRSCEPGHRRVSRCEHGEPLAGSRIDQGVVTVVDLGPRIEQAQRAHMRHREVAVTPEPPEHVAHRRHVTYADRRKQVMLDVIAAMEV